MDARFGNFGFRQNPHRDHVVVGVDFSSVA
jgi:hypothetical protein